MLTFGLCVVQEVDAETFPRAVRDNGVMTASCGGTSQRSSLSLAVQGMRCRGLLGVFAGQHTCLLVI